MAQREQSPAKAGQSNAAAKARGKADGQAGGQMGGQAGGQAGGRASSQTRAKASAEAAAPAKRKAVPKTSAKARPKATAQSAQGLSLARQRELAKVGMSVSLAVLVVTGFTGAHKRGPSRTLHLASGATLVGFSLWHHCLYGKPAAKPQENSK